MCKPKIVLSFLYVLGVKFFGSLIPLIVFLVKFSLGAVFIALLWLPSRLFSEYCYILELLG